MSEKFNPVQSIERVIDILEALSSVPLGMSLSDLAEATHLHISTTHRLVATLAERGYVCKDSNSGKYRLTLRLFEISKRVSALFGILDISEHFLKELAIYSHEAVHLVERSGNEVVYLYKFEPFQHVINMTSQVGARNPMYCTGVGKSILAQLPHKEVEKIWNATIIRAFTPQTITNIEDMYHELDLIRKCGYAFDNEEHDEGVRCIAAPIYNWERKPIGAVSISAPSCRLTDAIAKNLSFKLLETTNEISHLLGVK